MEHTITLILNGEERSVNVRTYDTLLEVLRREFDLHSARETCGIGICGACTVLLDGKPMSACLLLAMQADGCQVLTIEGLSKDGKLHPLQEAFIERNAFQCSYCTPGMILTAKSLLDEHPHPNIEQIKTYLSGNLCRCGSYLKIIQAVQDAARQTPQ